MAHSYIEAFDDESEAFESFARARPDNLVLLIDTYDTEAGARKVVDLAPRLKASGIKILGVRVDSGDLIALSKIVRRILDDGGLTEVSIFASGGIEEETLADFARQGAPIDAVGIGTSLTTSSDVPSLDCAYKLQEYAGLARRKKSTGKATWPGRKQVWRQFGSDDRMATDILSVEDDRQEGTPLLHPVMRAGRRVGPSPNLAEIRTYARRELDRLPSVLQRLEPEATYPVHIGESLIKLASEVDRRLGLKVGHHE
jgi:nicotinate phosphoribosyltransferase